jgi:hypothetical protein
MANFQRDGGPVHIERRRLAMNHWLIYDRNDLPEGITRLSFDSYTIPITADGTLPVTLFGQDPNQRGNPREGDPLALLLRRGGRPGGPRCRPWHPWSTWTTWR